MKENDLTNDKENIDTISLPQKKFYRSRAHCNPLSYNDSFIYPRTPDDMDWSIHYPKIKNPLVEIADIGCGFGGLSISLAKIYPNKIILAMEIRPKVTEYVRLRINALRLKALNNKEIDNNNNINYENVSVLRTNAMRYLPHYFIKGQLIKMFFCFPDPQFKQRNYRRRIINDHLLTEYAYFLKQGTGKLYMITDVEKLHDWHIEKCKNHPAFEQITCENELNQDPCIQIMINDTEEGIKVTRNRGKKYFAVFRRILDNEINL